MEQDNSRQPAAGNSLLSFFWTPLVAVGCSAADRLNAQISLSTFGASIIPERPRLLSVLYKSNYTHDLVKAKGSFSLTVLGEEQLDLLPALGFRSGRDVDKLAGQHYEVTGLGNPVFPDGLGWLDCQVIDTHDLGDATAFLAAVVEARNLRFGRPMIWSEVRRSLPAGWTEQWDRKLADNMAASLPVMRWLG